MIIIVTIIATYFYIRPDKNSIELDKILASGVFLEELHSNLEKNGFSISIWNGSEWEYLGSELRVPNGIASDEYLFDDKCVQLGCKIVYASKIQRKFGERSRFLHRFYYIWWLSENTVYRSESKSSYYNYEIF